MTEPKVLLALQVTTVNNIINFIKNTKQKTGTAKQNAYYYEARLSLLEKYWIALTDRHQKLIEFRKEYETNDYFAKDGYTLAENAYEAFHVNCPNARRASPKSCYF